ncbi:MAG TPA: extracellular solute-binding protein [Xanthobacteraceae bacterium]|jgi:ABC-type Fe3+ transport system substrate-binding protein|nr:extracellular solute-binding protein [Xanthobacteraceae bacterium]
MIAWPVRSFSSFAFFVSLLIGAAAAALPSMPPAHAQSMDELYQKAKLEKKIALVGAGPSEPYEHWIREFQDRYPGVTIAFTGGLSNGLNRRIDQQIASGNMESDLAIFQTIQDFVRWKRAGALQMFRPLGFDAIGPAFKDEDGAFTTVSVNMVQYAYNTNLVPAADVPKSALDFLKPQFQGKLITTDPTEDDASLLTFRGIINKYGWDYMDKYMAQHPAFVTNGHAAVSNAIATGEKLVTFDSTSTTPRLTRDGKPIQAVLSQSDDIPVFLVAVALFKDAPHPNAAKLFIDWYLAKEQQSRTGAFSARADVPPPEGFKPLSTYKIDYSYRQMLSDEVKLADLKKRLAEYIHR